MMKKQFEIEDKMKDICGDNLVTPPDFVWEKIEAELDRKNKRKRPIIWMFFGVLFLGIASLQVFQFTDDSDNLKALNYEKYDMLVSSKQELDELPSHTYNPIDISESEKVEIQSGLNEVNNISSNTTTSKQSPDSNKAKIRPIYSMNSGTNRIIQVVEDVEIQSNKNNLIDLPVVLNVENNHDIEIDSKNEILDISCLQPISRRVNFGVREINHETVECPNFKNKFNLDIFIELNGSLGSHQKRFGDQSPLALSRSSTESSYIDYGCNLSLGIYLTNNFYFLSGLDWYNSTDRFNLEREGLTKVVIDYDLLSGIPIDTSFVTGVISNNGLVNYRSIDVPITLGYRKMNKGWSYGLELGTIINLDFKSNGKIINHFGHVSTIEDETPVYKRKLGVGLETSVVLGRSLNNGYSVLSRLTYKNYLTDVNDLSYALPTKISFFRLEVGLRKEF